MTLAEKNAPSKYELLIRFLTLGRRDKVYQHVRKRYIKEDQFVLDTGCGTGKFLEIVELKWANPIGLDLSQKMLKQAQIKSSSRKEPFLLINSSIIALPIKEKSFDIVTSFLVLSELTKREVEMAIGQLFSCLKSNGLLIILTESKPTNWMKSIFFSIIRTPAYLLASLLTKTPKHPIHDLSQLFLAYDGKIIEERKYLGGHLTLFVLEKQ